MKSIILGLFMSLALVAGISAQERYGHQRYQVRDCRYTQDFYGRIYEQCREYPYRNYGEWRRSHRHFNRNERPRFIFRLGF